MSSIAFHDILAAIDNEIIDKIYLKYYDENIKNTSSGLQISHLFLFN